LEIDHVGQEQHKMKEQKAKQSLIGFHPDFCLQGVGGTVPNFGLQQKQKGIFCDNFLPNFPKF